MPEEAKVAAASPSHLKDAHRRLALEIAQGLSATLGRDFFRSVVRHMAAACHADYAYLAELSEGPRNAVRTVAVYGKQSDLRDFEQPLAATPVERVLEDGFFACRRHTEQNFPSDTFLQSFAVEGYAGIRLSDSAGQPLGILAIASRQRLTDIRLVRSLLETFAPRAAAELEQKRADDARRENLERYRAFIANNSDAMWRIEFSEPIPLSLGEDEQIDRIYRLGYIAECNDAFARLAGFERAEQMLGTSIDSFVPRTNEQFVGELRAAIRSGFRSGTVQFTPLDPEGRPLYRLRTHVGIVENGALLRIWITTRDITRLRRAELSLAASERRFREVLEGVQLPAIILDLQGTITFANRCFLGLVQRTREDLTSLGWLSGIIPAEESTIWKSILQPGRSVQEATTHFEGAIVRPDGPHHVVEWSTIGLRDPQDGLGAIAAIGRDATRERALEMEIRQAQKLDSIGRLATGLAHDFNNLLTVIAGRTTELLRQTSESHPHRSGLAEIEDAAKLCTSITGQLLAFGRKQHLNPEFIVLNTVIASAEPLIRGFTGAAIELHFDLQPSLWRTYADPAQILRALANLVTNARDAMPNGGTLTIATANLVVQAQDPEHPALKPGNYVRLSVADSGVGLSEEAKLHVFEPFFTTKAAGKGTGFGLATVYGIVTQSGGQILVCSEPGKGTTFEIVLPAASPSPAA